MITRHENLQNSGTKTGIEFPFCAFPSDKDKDKDVPVLHFSRSEKEDGASSCFRLPDSVKCSLVGDEVRWLSNCGQFHNSDRLVSGDVFVYMYHHSKAYKWVAVQGYPGL